MSDHSRRIEFRDQHGTPPVLLNLLIANGVMFVVKLVSEQMGTPGQIGMVERSLALFPPGSGLFFPWQLLTYGFLHGSFMHLAMNMLVLWMFGQAVCADFGQRRFFAYYILCILGAGLTHLAVQSLPFLAVGDYRVVGASGGTMGLLLAFGWRFPNAQIMLLIPPVPLKARTAVLVFGGLEMFLGVTGLRTGIAHFAHLGGLFSGIVLLSYWRGFLPFKPKQRLP